MGRKPSPHGKDRTRTIQLDGDLAEIAQDLADKSKLSATLSQLLRQSYGMTDDITRLEKLLIAATDDRKALQAREEELIQEIDAAKEALVHRQNHILPSLYQRQGVIEERLSKLNKQMVLAMGKHEVQRLDRLINENKSLLAKVLTDIKELES